MLQNYLTGLQFEKCDDWDKNLSGLYVIRGSNGFYYYISNYNTWKTKKQYFFDILIRYQKEIKKEWELHHIVEKQHLQSFYSAADLNYLYAYQWPCILIHKGEHIAYNSILHSKEPKILFDLKNRIPKEQLLNNIKTMYREAYSGNIILSTIAQNVLRQ